MKIIELILLLVFYAEVPFAFHCTLPGVVKGIILALGFVIYFVILFRHEKLSVADKRLSRLRSGTKLLWLSGMTIIPETAILIAYGLWDKSKALSVVLSVIFAVLFWIFTYLVGTVKITVSAKQIKLTDHLLLFLLWWMPVVNVILVRRIYKKAKREFMFELAKLEIENARAENEMCRTRYPVVMVHGIFFRDWQLMNYWGRVPATLIRNGAQVFYGEQQSAKSIPESAAELKAQIMKVLAETGAEKVNIIAHSKGGLDSRYAISSLGLGDKVATLTTINTPHLGSDMVDYLLGKFPEGLVNWIAGRYNSVFRKLGDSDPDFLAGVHDLSPKRLKELEPEMQDDPRVSYRSCMSVMKNFFSAGLPLNAGYLIIKKLNGRNDGLVWEGAAKHGSFRMVTASGTRGISHGDTIDLFRENIEGYDVREFYAELVAELKKEGF